MNTEKERIKQNQTTSQIQFQPQVQPVQVSIPTVYVPPTTLVTSLPFNVATDLNLFSKISIVKQYDFFKIVHCYHSFRYACILTHMKRMFKYTAGIL